MSIFRGLRGLVLSLCMAALAVFMPLFSFAQSNIEQFGQNRVQERKFAWKFFDTRHFRVYHYDKAGRQLGRYVAEEAEYDIAVVEKKLGGTFPQRFNIILYNSYDEYRQSNVGLKEESPLLGNSRAGSLKIVDDKLVVYFTGDHADLRRQIRSGMALVVMQRMIFGDNLKKMVKNALLLNLPDWVTAGYIAYLVDGWDEKSNSEWKGILDANPKKGFYELAELHPELGGKAFWKFVANQYGPATVKTLLYGMQQKSGLNKAMKDPSNLNMKVTKAYDSCIKYYRNVYILDEKKQDKPDSTNGRITIKVPKDNSVLRHIVVSPSGRDISYVAWKDGLYTVYMQKTTGSQTISKLLEGGQKDLTDQIDPSYPMLAWSKSGDKLAILYRAGSTTLLRIYNNNRGRIENYKIPKNRFDRVLSMAFMEDDKNLVFSAIRKSQTDLYMFSIRGTKMTNITDDVWDDLSPEFISGGSRTGILFLSNRPKPNIDVPVRVNELPAGPTNMFFYNTKTLQKELIQCTDVKKGRITQPVQYGPDNFAYLHDSNGINNKYVVLFTRNKNNLDSAYSMPVTNYSTSVVKHQYSPSTGEVTDVVQLKDKYIVYYHNAHMPGDSAAARSIFPTILSAERQEPEAAVPTDSKKTTSKNQSGVVRYDQPVRSQIKGGNVFQSEFSDNDAQPKADFGTPDTTVLAEEEPVVVQPEDSTVLTVITDSAYLKMKPAAYRNSFKPDFLSVKLDNTIIFNQYQSIAANGGQFVNPSLAALTTLSLNELMEDHRFTAGFQLPVSGANSTYFLQYQNFKRRVDWGILFLRSQNKEYKDVGYVDRNNVLLFVKQQLFKTTTHMAKFELSRPIDRLRSVRFNTLVREDRFVQKVIDTLSLALDFSNTSSYTSMSRLEFVFDNTITPALNIMNGTRYKVYAEYFAGLNNGNRSCYNIGLDFRHYQKLHKNFILANRVAYAHSDGSSMVQYLMGGVDNWMFPQNSANANQAPADHFGFQMLATSLRGYNQYARTGNNFGVVSTELRLPVVTTFVKRPVQSPMLKNLQLVAFVDAGTAWKGFLPDAGNLSNTYVFPNFGNPQGLNNVALSLTVPNSGGLAVGYGAGLRTSLSGYFVRLDAAWNIEGKPTPIVYFALGTDF